VSKDKTSEEMKRSKTTKGCKASQMWGCEGARVTSQKAKKMQWKQKKSNPPYQK